MLEPIKAPGGYPPALREDWTKLPRNFQDFIAKRERDMAVTMQEVSKVREFATGLKDIAAPYEELLTKGGTTFTDHVKELMQVSHTLHTGTPQQKAVLFANMLRSFQPDAETLRSLLEGKQVGTIAPVQTPHAPAPAQAAPAANGDTELVQFITKFAAENEFYQDVLPIMERVIDDPKLISGSTEAERIKNAYDFACQHDPDVKAVLAARGASAAPAAPAPAAPAIAPTSTRKPITSAKPSLGAGNRSNAPAPKLSASEAVARALKQHT